MTTDIAVGGPQVLLKALAQKWEENGLPAAGGNINDYLHTNWRGGVPASRANPQFYNHNEGVDKTFVLPEDWDKVADLGLGSLPEAKKQYEFKDFSVGDIVVIEKAREDSCNSSGDKGIIERTKGRRANIQEDLYIKVPSIKNQTNRWEDSFNLRPATEEEKKEVQKELYAISGYMPEVKEASVSYGCQNIKKSDIEAVVTLMDRYDFGLTRGGEDISDQIKLIKEKF